MDTNTTLPVWMRYRTFALGALLVIVVGLTVFSFIPGSTLNRYFSSGPATTSSGDIITQTGSAAIAQGDETQEFLAKNYGFTMDVPGLICNRNRTPENSTVRKWFTTCESNFDAPYMYLGVMWRLASSNVGDFQKNIGNNLLYATKDPTTRKLDCKSDTSFIHPKFKEGTLSDCVLQPALEEQNPIYFSLFYFNNEKEVGNVILFSDMGRGDVDASTFKILVRERLQTVTPATADNLSFFMFLPHAQIAYAAGDGGGTGDGGGQSCTAAGITAAATTDCGIGTVAVGGSDNIDSSFVLDPGLVLVGCANGAIDWPICTLDPVPLSTQAPYTCEWTVEDYFEFPWECRVTVYFTTVKTCSDGTITEIARTPDFYTFYSEAACPVGPTCDNGASNYPECSLLRCWVGDTNYNRYIEPCTSTPNACGQTNTGILQCDGSCSAVTPPDSNCPVIPSGCGPGTLNDTCPVLPDLTASAVVGATTVSVREKVSFTATITNIGSAAVDKSFDGFMQVETIAGGSIEDLRSSKIVETSGRRTLRSLSSGATGLLETEHTFTAVGNYNVRACADKSSRSDSGTIEETNEDNNCGPWSPVSVVVPLPTATLTATPSRIVIGKDSTLQWTSENATSCTSAGGFSTGDKKSGNEKVSPLVTSTYSITCSGDGGTSAPAVATVTVIVPTLAITATPARVLRGGQTTVSWNATDVRRCSIERNGSPWRSNMSANDADVVSGSVADTITTQTTYVLSCTDVDGSAYATVASVVVNVAADFQEF